MKNEGIVNIIDVGEDIPYSKKAVELANKYDFIYATVGAHPYSALELQEDDMKQLREWSKNEKVVAIGEIGLDYHKNHFEYAEKQKYWFMKQIEVAQDLGLPFVVHDRDAHEDCLEIFQKMQVNRGVVHCFSGDKAFAEEILKFNLYASFGGSLTYPDADELIEAVEFMPLDKILLETDCPYLTPTPHRGKRNDPRYVKYVAEKIAEIKKLPYDTVVQATYDNAWALFKR